MHPLVIKKKILDGKSHLEDKLCIARNIFSSMQIISKVINNRFTMQLKEWFLSESNQVQNNNKNVMKH